VFGLIQVHRTARDEVKFLLIVILSPIIQIVVARPPFMFVRYFLFAIVFALLLTGYGLAELARRGNLGRVACAVLLLEVTHDGDGGLATRAVSSRVLK